MVFRSSGFRFVTLAAAVVLACHGQERWDRLSLKTGTVGGIHLYGVSAYSGYSTLAGPGTGLNEFVPIGVRIGSDVTYGAQWTVGWQHTSAKSSLSMLYGGSYGGLVRYTNLNSFAHALQIGWNRQIKTKWNLSLTATGDYRTISQYLFQPTSLSVLSQLPSSATDLAAAFSVGSFSGVDAAATYSGTSSLDAIYPVQNLLLANRILTYQFQASASYAPTTRLSLSFSSLSGGGQQALDKTSTVVMPRTLGASAGMTLSYSLSPRTNIGANVTENWTNNQFQNAYSTSVTGFVGRMMGRRWFLMINGGMTYTRFGNQMYGTPPAKQQIGTASLGYRMRAQTLVASYNRSAVDAYGVAVGLNTRLSLAWNWARPGSAWRVFASAQQVQIRNTGFTSMTGWRANTGVSRALGRLFSVNADYAYLFTTGSYLGFHSERKIHSVRLSLRWHPHGVPRDGQEQNPRIPGVLTAPIQN